MMLKKISIFLAAVMLVVMGAGFAFAAPVAMVDGLAAGTVTSAYVNPGGLGDALIYGYYNVRSNMGNLFTVTNTSTQYGVRARIRVLEATQSCEIIDFDICLSAADVWTGLIMNNNGVGNLTVIDADTAIDTADPRGSIAGLLPNLFPNGINFRFGSDVACSDASGDKVTLTADDTLEGYFIVIAENQLAETSVTGATTCGEKDTNGAVKTLWDDLAAGSVGNVLYGNDYSVDLTNLNTYAYNATAIADFTDLTFNTSPIAENPNLASGSDGIIGLNFILSKNNVLGSYYDLGAGTEMVVTFPTKKATVAPGAADDIFDDSRVVITAYDTAENSKTSVCQLSPCPPSQSSSLPNEVNVISINGSSIVDSVVEVDIAVDYAMGWLNIDLVNALTGTPAGPLAHATTVSTFTASGLPAIGYVMTSISDNGFNWMLPLQYNNSVDNSAITAP